MGDVFLKWKRDEGFLLPWIWNHAFTFMFHISRVQNRDEIVHETVNNHLDVPLEVRING